MVTIALGSQLRARLEDGLIKLRHHDKGGDFVFARLGDTILLGLDDWNNFEVYRREAAPQQVCQAPIIYKEEPLSSNCGLDKDPADCCKAGDTQGCNRLGSMAALVNNWKKRQRCSTPRSAKKGCGSAVKTGSTPLARPVMKGWQRV